MVEQKLDSKEVTVDVYEVPLSDLLGVVSRRLGVQVSRTGSLYFIGTLRPEDKGVLVRKVGRLESIELKESVSVLLSEHGRANVSTDGVLVVGDRVEVLSRVHELVESVERASADSWVVQLHMVKVSKGAEKRLGLDVRPLLDVAATYATSGAGGVDGITGLSVLLKAESRMEGVSVVAEPLFVLVDGIEAETADASEIPIRRAIFDENRNVVSEDVEFRQIGLTVKVKIRAMSNGRARLQLSVEQSSVREFVDDAPIIDTEKMTTTAVVQSGGVYLLGSLERQRRSKDKQGIFGLELGKSDDQSRVQLWGRVHRIGGLNGAVDHVGK